MFDYLIVGAGFAGAVMAERLASCDNKKVLVVESRHHIGGNTYDYYNNEGILVHKYGPHIFHTNSREVFDYLSQFTAWRPYEHRVLWHAGSDPNKFEYDQSIVRIAIVFSRSREISYIQSREKRPHHNF